MSDFPAGIAARLAQDGWHRGRRVEPWDEVARLDRGGYPVFPAVWRFLVEFGGLVLRREAGPQPCRAEPAALDCTLGEVNPPHDTPEMQAITTGTGLALCLAGAFVYPGRPVPSAALLMDERGAFYRHMDRAYLDLIGHTPADMVTNFYDGLHSAQRIFTLDAASGAGHPARPIPPTHARPPATDGSPPLFDAGGMGIYTSRHANS